MTVDELVVSLLLDSSGFAKGQKDATTAANKMADDVTKAATKAEKGQTDSSGRVRKDADQTAKFIEAANKRAAQSFEKVIGAALTLFAVFAGARSLEEFTSKIINLEAAVGRLGQNLGTTPETLSSIGRAAERMGGSFGGAVSGLQGLSDAFEELRTTGQTSIMKPLAELQSLGGKKITFGKDVHENFLSIADDLKALKDKGEGPLANFLGRQILHDETLTNLAMKGRAGVLDEEAKSHKISAADTAAAQKYQETWESISQSIQHIGQVIVTDFAPAAMMALHAMEPLVKVAADWVDKNLPGYIKEFTDWLSEHKQDIVDFGHEMLGFVTAAASIAVAFAKQSPMMIALEAFAFFMGGRVLTAINLMMASMRLLGAMPIPAALRLLAAVPGLGAAALAAEALVATTSPANKDEPNVNPDGSLSYTIDGKPASREDYLRAHGRGDLAGDKQADAAPTTDTRNLWQKIMPKWLGGADPADSRTKDDIADTAKATGEMRDLMKAQKDGGGFSGVTVSSGGLGGSGHHFGGGSSPGASLGDRGQSGRGGPSALRSAQQKANSAAIADELRKAGAPDEGTAAVLGSMQTESSFNPRAHNDVAGGHTGLWQWDSTRWPKVRAWIEKQGGDPWDARWQAKAYIAEGRARPGDAIFDTGETSGGFRDVMDSKGNLGKAVHGVQRSERFGVGEEGGRAAHAGQWLGHLPDASAASAAETIGDAAYMAAQQRRAAGKPAAGDDALMAAYQRQQATPMRRTASLAHPVSHPTVDDAANHLVRAYRESSHRGPSGPVKVDVTDESAKKITRYGHEQFDARARGAVEAKHAAWARTSALEVSHARMASIANDNRSNSSSSETHIGQINVHTQATDAKGIAADIGPQLQRGQSAARSNYGLASIGVCFIILKPLIAMLVFG